MSKKENNKETDIAPVVVPDGRKVYATLFLVTGEDEQEALRRIVYGVMGFGSVLGDKIQCVAYDPDKGDPELLLPEGEILRGWLAVDSYNRRTTDYDQIEVLMDKVIAEVRDEVKLKDGESSPTVN